jgi:hypothetical protein
MQVFYQHSALLLPQSVFLLAFQLLCLPSLQLTAIAEELFETYTSIELFTLKLKFSDLFLTQFGKSYWITKEFNFESTLTLASSANYLWNC